MIFEVPIPGRVRLIAHAIREICNRLPDAIAGLHDSPRFDYAKKCDAIHELWTMLPQPRPSERPADLVLEAPDKPEMIPLPRQLVELVEELLAEHVKAGLRPRDNARRLFEALIAVEPYSKGRIDTLTGQWKSIGGAAVARCHDGGKPDNDTDIAELRRQLGLLEDILAALVQGFFSTVDELNAILEDTNP
jgi:hypothetical protein